MFGNIYEITGSINTIVTKIQDGVIVKDDEEHPIRFRHPVVQTTTMFLGEALCLLPFLLGLFHRRWINHQKKRNDSRYRSSHEPPFSESSSPLLPRNRDWRQETQEGSDAQHTSKGEVSKIGKVALAFSLPALCDAMATTLLNLGLFYTYASVYQMLRGTLVIFAGLLTIGILRRRLHSQHWMGMALITAGAALVGASSIIFNDQNDSFRYNSSSNDCHMNKTLCTELNAELQTTNRHHTAPGAPDPMLGNALVIAAQALNALQFIIEEKFIRSLHAPVLLAVGAEGLAGVILSLFALPILSTLHWPDGTLVDDPVAAFHEISSSWTLKWTTVGAILSIAVFNFAGVSVTQQLSGGSRAAIDACRTATVWLFCLLVGWERFYMTQLVGFTILIAGSSVYNDILRGCLPEPSHSRSRHRKKRRISNQALSAGYERMSTSDEYRSSGQGQEEDRNLNIDQIRPSSSNDPRINRSASESSLTLCDDESDVENTEIESSSYDEERGYPTGRMRMPPRSNPVPTWTLSGNRNRSNAFAMARSVTLLPSAWSPHSLASLPRGILREGSQQWSEVADSEEDSMIDDKNIDR